MTFLIALFLVAVLGVMIAFAVAFQRGEPRLVDAEPEGVVKGCEVRVIEDERGLPVVGLALGRKDPEFGAHYAELTPAQALQIAEWLRLAATPGKTLAVARAARRHKLAAEKETARSPAPPPA